MIFPKKCISSCVSEKPFGFVRLFFDDVDFLIFFRKMLLVQKLRKSIWGRPGGVREGILGAPGVSRGHFGRVLGSLGAILEPLLEQSDFKSIF